MAERSVGALVVVGGYNLSCYLRSVETNGEVELYDSTVLCNTQRSYVPGFDNATLSAEGFFESDSINENAIDDVLNAALGQENREVITIAPNGAGVIGKRCFLLSGCESSYNVTTPTDGLIQSNVEFQISEGLAQGVILHPPGEETADDDGASHDFGAATENGGVGHLHVTALSGTAPEITVTIQDSDDDSVFVDLIEFTLADAISGERKSVTGTVEQYTRASWAVDGTTPGATFTVAFARR